MQTLNKRFYNLKDEVVRQSGRVTNLVTRVLKLEQRTKKLEQWVNDQGADKVDECEDGAESSPLESKGDPVDEALNQMRALTDLLNETNSTNSSSYRTVVTWVHDPASLNGPAFRSTMLDWGRSTNGK